MKKLGILVLLILVGAIFFAVKFFILDKSSKEGKLKVFSSPTASLFIDNVAIGKTPYEETTKEGEYLIKLISEGEASASASWEGKVQVYKNALTYVDRELGMSDLTSSGVVFTTIKMSEKPKKADTGEIEIEVEPAGAIVYLDNDEKGIAPMVLSEVPSGDHELSVYSPGFFKRTQKINVDSGYRTKGNFKLALDQSQKKIDELVNSASEEASLEEGKKESTTKDTSLETTIVIKETPTGFLRVRSEPSLTASEEAQVKPKDTFTLLDEESGWYKIEYEKGKEGWVSAQYTEKQSSEEETP